MNNTLAITQPFAIVSFSKSQLEKYDYSVHSEFETEDEAMEAMPEGDAATGYELAYRNDAGEACHYGTGEAYSEAEN